LITIGRSTLVYGSRAEIQERLKKSGPVTGSKAGSGQDIPIFESTPPKLPERLSPGQAAQLSEVIDFLHHHVREIVSDAEVKPRQQSIEITADMWQQIVEA